MILNKRGSFLRPIIFFNLKSIILNLKSELKNSFVRGNSYTLVIANNSDTILSD